jgi:hypothetical protein
MKKHIYTVFAFAVFAASAFASQISELYVKVPFAFKAGSAVLPAGSYIITETVSGYVLIRGEKGGAFVSKGSLVVDNLDAASKANFKFDIAGDKYVLEEVRATK